MTQPPTKRTRYALIGTGFRGSSTWGRDLVTRWGDCLELVAMCDHNAKRAERSRQYIGAPALLYSDADTLFREVKPELAIICTPDYNHDEFIVKALEAGVDVITEKALTITRDKIRRIRDAERRTGRNITVAFNYRYAPIYERVKELLDAGTIGAVTSIDFHWYLDNIHGADYFRRWHAYIKNNGSLYVQKSTHHFDLLNWYIGTEPQTVSAFADLKHYGRNGPFRGVRCKTCSHKHECDYYFDLSKNAYLTSLFEDPSEEDGYFRDACVFREDIDVPDTMVAAIRYKNGVQVSYSLNAFMPLEGHSIAINGRKGRIEMRQNERQPWSAPPADEIVVMPNSGGLERIWVPHREGGHFGADNRLRDILFRGANDPLNRRTGSRDGAASLLVGLAALESSKTGAMVDYAKFSEGLLD
jgi:predicted dehydrogenase